MRDIYFFPPQHIFFCCTFSASLLLLGFFCLIDCLFVFDFWLFLSLLCSYVFCILYAFTSSWGFSAFLPFWVDFSVPVGFFALAFLSIFLFYFLAGTFSSSRTYFSAW